MTSSIYSCDICHKTFSKKSSVIKHSTQAHSIKRIKQNQETLLKYQNFISMPNKIFLDNKYTKLYYSIINNARHKTYDCYTEKHHILPRSLGGNDNWNNLITLSAREHFICHYLLTKMTDNSSYHKMLSAFMLMKASSNNQDRYFNSHLYENSKINFSQIQSKTHSGKNNSQYGTTFISNVQIQKCIKIKNTELDNYIKNGWIHKRIMNFNFNSKKVEKTNLKIVQIYRMNNGLPAYIPDKLLEITQIVNMNKSLISIGFNFLAEDLSVEFDRISKKLYNEYYSDNLSYVKLCKKYNIHLRSLEIIFTKFNIPKKGKNKTNDY